MKTRMFVFLLMSALMLLFAACGDETASSAASVRPQSGTVLNKNTIRQANTDLRVPVLKKTALPPVNIQTWPMVSTGQTKCYDYKQEIECPILYMMNAKIGLTSNQSDLGGLKSTQIKMLKTGLLIGVNIK